MKRMLRTRRWVVPLLLITLACGLGWLGIGFQRPHESFCLGVGSGWECSTQPVPLANRLLGGALLLAAIAAAWWGTATAKTSQR